jgi:hypothetical protein
MPWHCPACSTVIRHNEADAAPAAGHRYRCHVCRLTLDFDGKMKKLVIAPLKSDHHVEADVQRPRTIPAPVSGRRRKSPSRRGIRP